jgi:multiple sugar transport system substrate-binding protein
MIFDEANAAIAKVKSPEQASADLQAKVTAFMKKKGYLK